MEDRKSGTCLVIHVVKGRIAPDDVNWRHCCLLDCRVWSRLSEELLERVMLFLPLGSQLRFRSVCKRWLAMLSSSSFFIKSACVRPLPMICVSKVLSRNLELLTFAKPSDQSPAFKAHHLDMSYLPPQFDCNPPEVTLQDGLLCLRCSRWHSDSCMEEQFCLVNPFTKAWRQLPNLLLPEEDQEVWSVLLQSEVPSSNGMHDFNVSVLVEVRDMLDFVAVYSSATNSWQITRCEAWPVAIVPFASCENVLTCGRFCTYVADHLTLHSLEDGKVLKHAKLPSPASSYRLLGYDGIIFLAGQSDLTYGIWRLDASEMRWELMARVPDTWLLELTASITESEGLLVTDDMINGFREGSYICLVIRFSSLLDEFSHDRLRVIGFDIIRRTWHVFPEHESYQEPPVYPSYLEPKLHLNDFTLALAAGSEGLRREQFHDDKQALFSCSR